MEQVGTLVGRLLPEMPEDLRMAQSPTSTASTALTADRPRLSDAMLAKAEAIANAPLPALAPCGEEHLAKVLRTLLAVLPKRGSDEVSGALLIEAYEAKLGGYSREQISFLGDQAMERCQWFPSIAECYKIIEGWERGDDHIRLQRRAAAAARHERQARFDDMMARLAAGNVVQAEIDALPDSWKAVGETRAYLRVDDDGCYVSRVGATAAPAPVTEAPARPGPACRTCQDVRRILTMEGNEVDCPNCGEARPC